MIVDGRTISRRCWWDAGDIGTRKRKAPPRAFVYHWTGGTRDARGVCETLRARSLSIHYVIDPDGRIVQCCDPVTTVAYHAGAANAWTIGCEIVGGPKVDFTPEQYASIGELADMQTLPRVLFVKGDDLATFSGHLEHLHLTPRKIDAGLRVMRFLRARWALPSPV